MLESFCKVCDGFDEEFIGLRFIKGKPYVTFPRGFRISDTDTEIRKDIIHLLTVLQKFSDKKEGNGNRAIREDGMMTFPILSYQYVLYDYLSNGYYSEKDIEYKTGDKGKVSWKRTINSKKPIICNGNAIYLDLVTKKSVSRADIITKVHEYCVFESFEKIGWLYLSNDYMPRKPSISFNKKVFLSVLNDALKNTYNNNKKILFNSMIDIISMSDESANFPDSSFGVTKFEIIWEKLIDYVYGVENKNIYFPHGHYLIIKDGKLVNSSVLEPDTIMIMDNKVFILDAKYYKYGITSNKLFLPPTSSIQKQITYGDYVLANKFTEINNTYNAFIIPFDSKSEDRVIDFAGIGFGDWVEYNEDTANHKYVVVILLDTNHLINTYAKHKMKDIEEMASFISESLKMFRDK